MLKELCQIGRTQANVSRICVLLVLRGAESFKPLCVSRALLAEVPRHLPSKLCRPVTVSS